MSTSLLVFGVISVVAFILSVFGFLGGPDIVRMAVSFSALFVVPGALASALFFPSEASSLERTCRVFALGIVFASLVVCTGFIPGVSFRGICVIAAVLTIALGVPCFRRRPGAVAAAAAGETPRADAKRGIPAGVRTAIVAAVLFAVCFVALYGTGELGWVSDAPDHVSFIRRSVDSGALFPRDSFYREGDGASLDPRKGLWHPVLALWTYASRTPADRLWRAIPSFVAFFALCAFLWFAVELCRSKWRAALALLLLLLLYGGEGFPWLAKLGFSRNIAQVLLWAGLAFLIRFYRSSRREYLAGASLLAAIGAAYHIVFPLLLATSLFGFFLYVTFAREGREWRRAFWASVPFLLAATVAAIAPRLADAPGSVNFVHTHRQGMLVLSRDLAIVDFAELATRNGLAFFFMLCMAPFYFFVVRPFERRSLVFVLYIVPVLVVLNPVTASILERRLGYLHYRILDAAPLVVALACVIDGLALLLVAGKPLRDAGNRSLAGRIASGAAVRALAAVALALFLIYPAGTALRNLSSETRSMAERGGGAPSRFDILMKDLDTRIPAHSVIVSDPLTSYLVSAYTDHFIAAAIDQHGSPTDTLALERLEAVRDLMSPAAPLGASVPWLAAIGADYVLVNAALPEHSDFFTSIEPGSAPLVLKKLESCPAIVRRVFDRDGFYLFQVTESPSTVSLAPACNEAGAGVLPCGTETPAGGAGVDAGCGLVLASIGLDRYLVQPGDTIRGHFCWFARARVPFGLPLDVVVRIDTPFPKGRLYAPWYGKQYRRIMERRNSRFYRSTWTSRVASGFSQPDQWVSGRVVRQDFALPLSAYAAPGDYELYVRVVRTPYLMNRTIADYLSNDDSRQGVPVGMIRVGGGV